MVVNLGGSDRRWQAVEPCRVRNDRQLMRLESEWQRALTVLSNGDAGSNDQRSIATAWHIRDIEREVIATPAQSLVGLAVKVRFLDRALALGPTPDDEYLCESTLADLDQMIKDCPRAALSQIQRE